MNGTKRFERNMYSAYPLPKPSSIAASSVGILWTYPPTRNATIAGESQFPYAKLKPSAQTNAPVYDGCRISRYGPVCTTGCSGCVWTLKVKDSPSSRAAASLSACPSAAVVSPATKIVRRRRAHTVADEATLMRRPPPYESTRPRPTARPEPLSRLTEPMRGFCLLILYSDHTKPANAVASTAPAGRLVTKKGCFLAVTLPSFSDPGPAPEDKPDQPTLRTTA